MANAWREHFDRMPPLAWQRRFLAATLGCTIDASTSPAPDVLSKAAREALCRERHRTLPFRKAANAIASNSTKKDLDVHRPFVRLVELHGVLGTVDEVAASPSLAAWKASVCPLAVRVCPGMLGTSQSAHASPIFSVHV